MQRMTGVTLNGIENFGGGGSEHATNAKPAKPGPAQVRGHRRQPHLLPHEMGPDATFGGADFTSRTMANKSLDKVSAIPASERFGAIARPL